MKTLLKVFLGLLATFVVLLLAVIVAVVLFVDPNAYRPQIEAAVHERTGRTLSIEGDLSLALFPCCAIELGRTSLSNPPGFADAGFASVERVRLGLELLPLLFDRKLIIGQVELRGLDVSLLRDARGRDNWTFDSGEPTPAPDPAADDGEEAMAPELSVASIDISNARLSYQDQQAGSHYELSELNLQTGAVAEDQPFELEASLRFRDIGGGLAAKAGLNGVAQLDLAGQQLRLEPLTAEVQAEGEGMPAGGLGAGIRMAGLDADLESGVFDLRGLAVEGRLADTEFALNGSGRYADSGTRLQGDFRVPRTSLRKLLQKLSEEPVSTADPDALSRFEATGNWTLGDDSLRIDSLAATLDDTRIEGDAAVSAFAKPRVRINLRLDQLELDRYLAPEEQQAASNDQPTASELPREALRDLYLDGDLGIQKLRVTGLHLEQVQATARARDGVLILSPLTATLYGGRYEGSIRVDATGPRTRLGLQQSLDAVSAGGLLADFADVEQLEGLLAAKVDLEGSGNTDSELRDALAGTVEFKLADGVYQGLDIWYEIRKARALIRGEPAPARTGPAQTPITALDFGGKLRDGVLGSDRFLAQIPFLRITGTGNFGLAEESLDYRLSARVVQTPEFDNGDRLDDLQGLTIPLTVTGTLEKPKLGVDLAEFAKSAAGQQLRKKLIKKLGLDAPESGSEPEQNAAPEGSEQQPPPEQPQQKQKDSPEDALKRGLRELLGG